MPLRRQAAGLMGANSKLVPLFTTLKYQMISKMSEERTCFNIMR
jgi:hypothetical protein